MSFISLNFLALVVATVILYYVIPIKYRWGVLLAASAFFYAQGGWFICVVVLLTTVLAYFMARCIEKTDAKNKKKRRLILSIALIMVIGFLVFVKVYSYLGWKISFFVVPMGISYYTFGIVGYLADVYWGKEKAEKNFLKLALFVIYFPKILQGPISKHKNLAKKLEEGHEFDYKNFTFGIQLALWGLFKKLVIADRANILVSTVYGDLVSYNESGSILLVTMFLSVVQLYCDFSGYMDIARGVSQMFGVELESNFNHPFFSKSASEFWRRWHITLGEWFKDYLYMPIVISPKLIKVSGWFRKHMGKRAGKAVMNIVPLTVVWILTGLWHGTGINYLVWGIYWGSIIIFADVFGPELKKIPKILHINTEAPTYKLFQILRTCGIYAVGKMISAQSSLAAVKVIARGIIKFPNIWNLFDGSLYNLGLGKPDMIILIAGILIVWFVSYKQEKGMSMRESIAEWNAIPRWVFYGLSVLVIVLFGVYGASYSAGIFAYQFF